MSYILPVKELCNTFWRTNLQITIEADIGEIKPRWMAIDDIKFSVVSDEQCITLPPEADPNPPSTSPATTIAPYRGISQSKQLYPSILM